ncbi:MAG: translation elongation factor EF-1 subunit alpha [Nitrososphaeria archaeon]
MSSKPHLNLVVTGHVDHGKSTTMGHFLVEMGGIDRRVIEEYAKESEKIGAGDTFKYAWVLDRLKDERERGVTIDLAFQKFETKKYYYTLIDAPGHRDFVKNMITGASQADVGIVVLSAKPGETEVGVGFGGQTREHSFLLKTLGVQSIIGVINKMDDATVKYSEARYKEVRAEFEKLLRMTGYDVTKIPFIPVSGWVGDNLTQRSTNMPWYKGPTLLEALDQVPEPTKPTDKPFRMPVQDVYSITGVGTVPVGRIETGVVKPGDKVVINPGNLVAEVKSIEMHHQPIEKAIPGDNVGMNLRGVSKTDLKRGFVIGNADNPPTVAKEFIAQIIVIYHPSAISAGYTPVLHAHTAQVATTFKEILAKIDPRSGQVVEEKPKSIKTGDSALVRLAPLRPLVIEPYSQIPQLGRFAIRDMGTTIGAGIVKEVTVKG